MALSGTDYLKSRFGVMNIAEILLQLVLIICLTVAETKMWWVGSGPAVKGPLVSATFSMGFFASISSLMTVVALLLFYSLRKSDWQILTAWSCIAMGIWSLLHFICLCLTADVANRLNGLAGINRDFVDPIAAAAFFHLSSSIAFGVDSWMQWYYRGLLAAGR